MVPRQRAKPRQRGLEPHQHASLANAGWCLVNARGRVNEAADPRRRGVRVNVGWGLVDVTCLVNVIGSLVNAAEASP